jgi:hypothetical protein
VSTSTIILDLNTNMTNKLIVFIVLAFGAAACASDNPQPYSGQHSREIKALSSKQVEGLLTGSGMGFALPAELNGYPGPKHVLELAEDLGLSAGQTSRTKTLFEEMQMQAAALGAKLVDAERELEQLFASGSVDVQNLQAALELIEGISAKLRQTHLQAHIQLTALLSSDQVATYKRLRGYGGVEHDGRGHGGDHGKHH